MIQALQFILALLLLVITHEAGHLLFARLFGVRVDKFYVFFNPGFSLFQAKKFDGKYHFRFFQKSNPTDEWSKHPEHTEWGIGWLPLGGYCKIAGMIDESFDDNAIKPHKFEKWEYLGISPYKRIPIITGGVLVNFLSAILIYGAILFFWGQSYLPINKVSTGFEYSATAQKIGFQNGDIPLMADGKELHNFDEQTLRAVLKAQTATVRRHDGVHTISLPDDFGQEVIANKEFLFRPILPFVIDSVLPNSPADGKLHPGDSLIALNGVSLPSFHSFKQEFSKSAQRSFAITLQRGQDSLITELTTDSAGHIGVIPFGYGHYFTFQTDTFSLPQSFTKGISLGVTTLAGYISDFRYLFSDQGYKNLGGFASIGSLFAPVWDWHSFWSMTAMLAVILAFMNILPIPALDGGHLLFLFYEILTGKKPSPEFLIRAQTIGMIILLTLFFMANINDFLR